MHVYVITNPELGWDCVVGVVKATADMTEEDAVTKHLKAWDNYSDDDIAEILNDGSYIAHCHKVEA